MFKKSIPAELRGGLRLVEVKNRCDGCPPWRLIDYFSSTSNKPIKQEKVTVQAGYRAMYSYPGTDYFSNTKIEQSAPSQYENDKEIVIDAIKHDYKTKTEWVARYLKENKDYRDKVEPQLIQGKDYISLEENKYKGFEYISITDSVIGLTGGTISQIHIFIPDSEIIVTAYLLWQKNAKFYTMDEFSRLRAEFIEGYIDFIFANSGRIK